MGKSWRCIIHPARSKMNVPPAPTLGSPKSPSRFLQTLRNSPSLLRKKFSHNCEGDDQHHHHHRESPNLKERTFHVRYGGRVPVRSLCVRDAVIAVDKVVPPPSAQQQHTPVHTTCCLRVDKSTITFEDTAHDILESLPLFCIAYCATDLRHPRAVALTCKTTDNIHCYVFECATKDKASEIVNYIRRAFEGAWMDWKKDHCDDEDPRDKQTRHSPPSHVPL